MPRRRWFAANGSEGMMMREAIGCDRCLHDINEEPSK